MLREGERGVKVSVSQLVGQFPISTPPESHEYRTPTSRGLY